MGDSTIRPVGSGVHEPKKVHVYHMKNGKTLHMEDDTYVQITSAARSQEQENLANGYCGIHKERLKESLGWSRKNQIDTMLKLVGEEQGWERYRKLQITDEQWEAIKAQHNHECVRCHCKETPEHKLTKDRIHAGSDYSAENVQLLCVSCNSIKYDRTIDYRR